MKNLIILTALLILVGCGSQESNKITTSNLDVAESLDFGEVAIGANAIQSISIVNNENEDKVISVSSSNASFTVVYSSCSNLKRGRSCSVKVLMETSSAGDKEGLLIVNDDEVELIGKVLAPESQTSSLVVKENSQEVSSVDFGIVIGASIKTLIVENQGSADVPALSISGLNNFILISNTCNKAVKRGKSCSIKVSFSSSGKANGEYSDDLEIDEVSIELSATVGSGVPQEAELEVSENSQVLEEVDYGVVASSLIKSISIKNIGEVASEVLNIVVPASFSKIYDTCSGKALGKNKTCLIKIMFSAQGKAPGEISENLSIGDLELPLKAEVEGEAPTPTPTPEPEDPEECPSGEHFDEDEQMCVSNIRECTPDELNPINNAVAGIIEWDGASWAYCYVSECDIGYLVDTQNNQCAEETISCQMLPEGANSGFQHFDEGTSQYGECQIQDCQSGYDQDFGLNACFLSQRECESLPDGASSGIEYHEGSGAYGACEIQNCQSGYTLDNGENACFLEERSCENLPANAIAGIEYYEGSGMYGECQISSCDSGYTLDNNECVEEETITMLPSSDVIYKNSGTTNHHRTVTDNILSTGGTAPTISDWGVGFSGSGVVASTSELTNGYSDNIMEIRSGATVGVKMSDLVNTCSDVESLIPLSCDGSDTITFNSNSLSSLKNKIEILVNNATIVDVNYKVIEAEYYTFSGVSIIEDSPKSMATNGGYVYFIADSGMHRMHLTTKNVERLTSASSFSNLISFNNELYFTESSRLKKIDSDVIVPAAPTHLVISAIEKTSSHLYFVASNRVYRISTSGVVSELTSSGSSLGNLIAFNNEIFFASYHGAGRKIYKIQADGTPVQVSNIRSGDDIPSEWIVSAIFNNDLYYIGYNSSGRTKLMKINSLGEISQVSNIRNNQSINDAPAELFAGNNGVYFYASDADGFRKIFRYNGNSIERVSNSLPSDDDNAGGPPPPPPGMILINDLLFDGKRYGNYRLNYSGRTFPLENDSISAPPVSFSRSNYILLQNDEMINAGYDGLHFTKIKK